MSDSRDNGGAIQKSRGIGCFLRRSQAAIRVRVIASADTAAAASRIGVEPR